MKTENQELLNQAELGNKFKDDVSVSLLNNENYWKQRCLLAEKCLEESPCDPDITELQIKAHNSYHKFISHYGNER